MPSIEVGDGYGVVEYESADLQFLVGWAEVGIDQSKADLYNEVEVGTLAEAMEEAKDLLRDSPKYESLAKAVKPTERIPQEEWLMECYEDIEERFDDYQSGFPDEGTHTLRIVAGTTERVVVRLIITHRRWDEPTHPGDRL